MENIYSFPVSMLKAGEEKEGRIPVEIIPNAPSVDRVRDKIVLKAFDQDCIDGFLHDGTIDFDHLSILSKDPIVKAQAIIGQPTEFFVDRKRSLPVCRGFLFADNPFVKGAILPAMKAGSTVFGASLGGNILQKSSDFDGEENGRVNTISRISIKHIAITPLQKAVHQGTSVRLMKSADGRDEFAFPTFESFVKSFEDGAEMLKAMEAGSGTDIAAISGGQALQTQSLEGDSYNKVKYAIPFVLRDIYKGNIRGHKDLLAYLMELDYTADEAAELCRLVATQGNGLAKQTW